MTHPLEKLSHELAKLPGIGEKTALRFALHILRQPAEYAQGLAQALNETVARVVFCQSCYNIALGAVCDVCAKPGRNEEEICVVQDVAELMTLERARVFKGRYHVLHGALSPIDGIGPENLRLEELVSRIRKMNGVVREVILATNPDVNGDATAFYISRLLHPFEGLKITRLAAGIPVGSSIEYADGNTLSRAFERRTEFG